MSVCRKLPDGTIQKIAGHTILLDANVSEIREGTISIPALSAGSSTTITVTFTDPMPDTDYIVIFDNTSGGSSVSANCSDIQRTVNGFVCNVQNVDNSTAHTVGTVHYHAFKLVKIEGYTELQNKVNNPDTTPTENSTNLCTSGGIYDFVKNASSIFVGTSTEWAAEPDQTIYDIAVITDEHKILSIDKTAGTTAEQANLNKIFRGTLAEWEALSQAEKDYYDQAEIVDDQYMTNVNQIVAHDKVVAVADWQADATYSGFSYKAEISMPGVTADYSPEIRLSMTDRGLNIVVDPVGSTDKVTVYTNTVPASAITIPVIICTLMTA